MVSAQKLTREMNVYDTIAAPPLDSNIPWFYCTEVIKLITSV